MKDLQASSLSTCCRFILKQNSLSALPYQPVGQELRKILLMLIILITSWSTRRDFYYQLSLPLSLFMSYSLFLCLFLFLFFCLSLFLSLSPFLSSSLPLPLWKKACGSNICNIMLAAAVSNLATSHLIGWYSKVKATLYDHFVTNDNNKWMLW